ncbi:hypothetical protein L6452_02770 [Arctium lappa]|uniref:Uncharacterized protein n=1 Tax=Arctium lappa TaxID=4217 RepID=A0ACB9FKG8_ARCLA|nr:hypothetical protein L6452_02770 [Arctium lappa]
MMKTLHTLGLHRLKGRLFLRGTRVVVIVVVDAVDFDGSFLGMQNQIEDEDGHYLLFLLEKMKMQIAKSNREDVYLDALFLLEKMQIEDAYREIKQRSQWFMMLCFFWRR